MRMITAPPLELGNIGSFARWHAHADPLSLRLAGEAAVTSLAGVQSARPPDEGRVRATAAGGQIGATRRAAPGVPGATRGQSDGGGEEAKA